MGEKHTRYDVQGKEDEWSYGVLVWAVPPSKKYSADSLKLLFQFKKWVHWPCSGQGPFPKRYYNIVRRHYQVSGRLSVSGGREEFKAWLDRRHVSLDAQDDALRLVFENPKWTKTEVVGLMVRIDTYKVREEEEEELEEVELLEEEEEEEEETDEDEDGPISYDTYQTLERLTSVQERETNSCAICWEELELSEDVRGIKLPCSDVFHESCIFEWLFNHRFCPICRFKLPVCPADCECEGCDLARQFGVDFF